MAKYLYSIIILFCVCLLLKEYKCETRRPHIIFIMADDLGWNDVGFHGSSQIPTPNIDALAYSGLILNNYYMPPICTPSRSAFMTGKYPIHTGMQHLVLYGAEARGLPLNETLLPQYLKRLGYSTHIVGKWHLGSYKKEYTPTYRGFDSHLGHWTGHHDYFDHTAVEQPGWGLDMRRNMDVAYDLHGAYSTDVYTNEAEKIITNHDMSKPLFLYLSHAAVHSGNPYNPIPAPDDMKVAKFNHIKDYPRRRFAAVLTKLDESVGKVVKTLNDRGMLEDSIIIFSTDNGGAAKGFDSNAASNWPLRGVKDTLWEGGVRGAALLWSGSLPKPHRVAQQRMHMVDWLPTLYHAAGGDTRDLGNIDGLDMWEALAKDEPSKRNEILHNIDDIYRIAALTVGDWKIIKGSSHIGQWNLWYGPHGRSGTYSTSDVSNSPSWKSLASIKRAANVTTMASMRSEAEIKCFNSDAVEELADDYAPCFPFFSPCLFNIEEDPCEKRNLANLYPRKLKELMIRLEELRKTAVPPGNLPLDERGNPKHWGYVWTNFGDLIKES